MLIRVHIDNFRCFSDFEISVGPANLFLGPNGTGKSSIFEVLRKIQTVVRGDRKIRDIFSLAECTRWRKFPVQRFELDVRGNGGTYRYEIAVEPKERIMQIRHERLRFDNKPLMDFKSGNLQLYRDDHSRDKNFQFARDQSVLALLPAGEDNKLLTWFKKYMEQKLVILKIDPTAMVSDSKQEENRLSETMDNFVSWYRHISQDQGKVMEITGTLKEILKDFDNFRFAEAGLGQILEAGFSDTSDNNRLIRYQFHELSDGQRVLIALYTLIYAVRSQGVTLCMDEPENFLALPEIQPWLLTLDEFCDNGEMQALLISHHPQLIDDMAVSSGCWFERHDGSVQVRRITENDQSGLPVSELVSAGWLHE